VRAFFGLTDDPDDLAAYDLGGRKLQLIACPWPPSDIDRDLRSFDRVAADRRHRLPGQALHEGLGWCGTPMPELVEIWSLTPATASSSPQPSGVRLRPEATRFTKRTLVRPTHRRVAQPLPGLSERGVAAQGF